MASNIENQVMALAAIFQQAALVETLAKTGHINTSYFETAVNALLCQNPDEPIQVFERLQNLETGFETMIEILTQKSGDKKDIIRYVMGVMHLQKQLQKRRDMLNIIGTRLEKSHQQNQHFSATHENVIGGLADIYTDTISQLSFRIQVMGEYNHLQQPRIANQIRVLLFAGIRSAVLWRQLGGSRLKIIFQRKELLKQAKRLLDTAKRERLH